MAGMNKKQLEKDIAQPTLTGVRTIWTEQVTSGLTPSSLATILKDASETTNAADFLKLAEEMEEKDLHYASVLATRKRAVEGIEGIIKPASDDKKDQELAELVRTHIIDRPEFIEMSFDLLDALAKGFCVMEIEWQTGQVFIPAAYHYRPQRFFKFDEATGRELRLLDESDPRNGLELPPYKFIIHTPRLKSGLPIRGGLARLVSFAFICKAYTVKDWQAFLEIFGMPLRLGKYDAGINKDDMATLRRAVANIGSDAAAVIPKAMEIEFVQAARGGGSNNAIPFKDSAEWWDRQISKAVLGQTASAEGTPGKLGNEDAQSEVRLDILRSDCRQLAGTINRDLIRPFIDLNYGPQERYPVFQLPVIEPEDTAALVDGLSKLVPLGLTVKLNEVRARLGLSEPQEDDEVLKAPAPSSSQLNNLSLNRQTVDDEDRDLLLSEALADWQDIMEPMIDTLAAGVNSATSFDDLLDQLDQMPGQSDLTNMIRRLGDTGFKARAEGDVNDV